MSRSASRQWINTGHSLCARGIRVSQSTHNWHKSRSCLQTDCHHKPGSWERDNVKEGEVSQELDLIQNVQAS